MNDNYSEALERQVALAAWARSQRGQEFCSTVLGTNLAGLVRQFTEHADPYFISGEIAEFLGSTASKLPSLHADPRWVMATEDQLGAGFAWLATPIALPRFTAHGGEIVSPHLVALAWGAGLRPNSTHDDDFAICVVPWVLVNDATRPRRDVVVPWAVYEWRPTETQQEAAARERPTEGDYARTPEQQAIALVCLNLLGSLLLFMDQRVFVAPRETCERHARRRLERDGWHGRPLVRVVQLRRVERLAKKDSESRERDYHCQWLVRGHWRQQFYPSKHTNQPIWITPYVKGPDDKPLKPPRATVFAVVR
jgi:hypothetical protein